jgi:hypothetical protein
MSLYGTPPSCRATGLRSTPGFGIVRSHPSAVLVIRRIGIRGWAAVQSHRREEFLQQLFGQGNHRASGLGSTQEKVRGAVSLGGRSSCLATRAFIASLALATFFSMLQGCSGAPPRRDIVVLSPDGFRLSATVLGKGTRGVLLAHDQAWDKASLGPLAFYLAERGFLVITFNFRGYPGSDGVPDPSMMDRDVLGAASALVKNFGARTVSYVGFGTGALVVAKAATSPDFAPRSLGLIGMAKEYGPIDMNKVLPELFLPKVFMVPDGVPSLLSDTEEAMKLSPQPKEMFVYPADENWFDPKAAATAERSGVARLEAFLKQTAKVG